MLEMGKGRNKFEFFKIVAAALLMLVILNGAG
jgi:hypothetical protein